MKMIVIKEDKNVRSYEYVEAKKKATKKEDSNK